MASMIDGYLLRYFLAIVETGSFTAAAARVNVTQPTLSAGVAKLERELGVPLFIRSARRVELTEAGARFLQRARNIMQEYNAALGEIGEPARRRALRLGLLHTVPASIGERLVRDWQSIDGANGLEIVEGSDTELVTRLDQGRVDMALSLMRAGADKYAPVAVCEEPYLLMMPEDHALAGHDPVPSDALHSTPMVVRRRCEVLSEVSRHFTGHGVRPPLAYRTVQEERALAMVAAGLGVTVMPASYSAPGIVQRRLSGFDRTRTLAVLQSPVAMALRSDVARMTSLIQEALRRQPAPSRAMP